VRASLAAAALALAALPGHTSAQARPPAPQVVPAALSADTVGFGDTFELRVELRVPEGRVALVPDAPPSSANVGVPSGPTWTVEAAADGSAVVSLAYPLIGYRVGPVTIPAFAVYVGPAAAGDAGPVRVFAQDDAPRAEGLSPYRVPVQEAWVLSLLRIEDVAQGLEPRPADDVIGGSWNAPALASALAFASILLGIAFVSGRDWLDARARRTGGPGGPAGDPRAEARRAALAELDRLLSAGLAGPDEAEALYRSSSTVVRRYVEELESSWGPSYTSTELMTGLETLRRSQPLGALKDEMLQAERVKFGRLRPDVAEAMAHCRTLREWVASS